MIDFKIVKGGFYRTRDNRKVECLRDDLSHELYSMAITDGIELWSCTRSGNTYRDSADIDIVGVWEEPKPKRLCYREVQFGALKMFTEEEFKKYKEMPFKHALVERYPCALDEV